MTYEQLKEGFLEYKMELSKNDDGFVIKAFGNEFKCSTIQEVILFAQGFDLGSAVTND